MTSVKYETATQEIMDRITKELAVMRLGVSRFRTISKSLVRRDYRLDFTIHPISLKNAPVAEVRITVKLKQPRASGRSYKDGHITRVYALGRGDLFEVIERNISTLFYSLDIENKWSESMAAFQKRERQRYREMAALKQTAKE